MPSTEPYYRRIMADIRSRIAENEWRPGHQLPSTSKLAKMYAEQFGVESIGLGTVRQAVTILIEAGVLRGHQGLAVFVAGEVEGEADESPPIKPRHT